MEKRASAIGFRPTQRNRGKLEKAQELGFELTELLNGMLDEHFDSYLSEAAKKKLKETEAQVKQLRSVLAPSK